MYNILGIVKSHLKLALKWRFILYSEFEESLNV